MSRIVADRRFAASGPHSEQIGLSDVIIRSKSEIAANAKPPAGSGPCPAKRLAASACRMTVKNGPALGRGRRKSYGRNVKVKRHSSEATDRAWWKLSPISRHAARVWWPKPSAYDSGPKGYILGARRPPPQA